MVRRAGWLWMAVIIATFATSGRAAVFSDDFSLGGDPAWPWVVKNPGAEVVGGRLRVQSSGGPRDALVTAFDRTPSPRDYRLGVTVDPVERANWTHANVIVRANDFNRGSSGTTGSGYQVQFIDNFGTAERRRLGSGPVNFIRLTKVVDGRVQGTLAARFVSPLASPFRVDVTAVGGNLRVDVDGALALAAVDPNPLLDGGVGLHTIWEATTFYDDVVLETVPLPGAFWLLAAGLAVLTPLARARTNIAAVVARPPLGAVLAFLLVGMVGHQLVG